MSGATSTPFQERVEAVVRALPEGAVVSYGEVAAAIGAPRSARQVGWAMARCSPGLPWHRVLNSRGELSGDPVHQAEQRARLETEGHRFDGGRLSGWTRSRAHPKMGPCS